MQVIGSLYTQFYTYQFTHLQLYTQIYTLNTLHIYNFTH